MPPLDLVQASYDVQAAHACGSGARAAIHFQTAKGRVVIKLPMRIWRELAQAQVDANGNPWPTLRTDGLEGELLEFPAGHERGTRSPNHFHAQAYEGAWIEWQKNPAETLRELGKRLNLHYGAISAHFLRLHRTEYIALSNKFPRVGPRRSPELLAKLEQAYREYRTEKITVRDLARRHEMRPEPMYVFFRDKREAAKMAEREAQGPLLKPSGEIL